MSFYRRLLRLYPRGFRLEYEHELTNAFEQRTAGTSALSMALAAIADVVPNAIAAHWEILRRDLAYALRALARAPGFAVTAIVVVALGVGANTAAFSLADLAFMKPLPYKDSDRLVRILESTPQGGQNELAPPNYRDWKNGSSAFASMAAWVDIEASLAGAGEPRRLTIVRATPGFFSVLGVPAHIGRLHDTTEVSRGDLTVVLSHGLWQRQFGGDAAVLGRAVRLDEDIYTVVGVMPPSFNFPQPNVDAWTQLALTAEDFEDRNNNYFDVIARMRDGVTLADARTDLARTSAQIREAHRADVGELEAQIYTLREFMSSRSRTIILALCGAALCILLLACANIASLFLARASHRARELAVRTALGAGQEVLVRQLATETATIIIVGGALGLLLAWLIMPALALLVPPMMPVGTEPVIDGRILLFAAGVVVLTGLLAGVAPALGAGRARALDALRDGTRSGGGRTQRARATFVVIEIAASVVLLVLSGLLIRAVARIEAVDPGFNARNVLTMRVAVTSPRYDSVARRAQFYERVLAEVRSLPGVQSAAFISGLPVAMRGGIWSVGLTDSLSVRQSDSQAGLRYVTTDYLKTMGIRLLRGRDISATDDETSARVAVVSQSFVRRHFPNEDPIGKQFWFAFQRRTIVGVAAEVHVRGREFESEPQIYLPYRQVADASIIGYFPKDLAIRSTSGVALTPAVARAIRAADPDLPISNVRMMREILEGETGARVLQIRILAILAAVGLLIAGVGIHGLLTYAVSTRSQELGVRRALGAQSGGIVRLVVGEGMRLTAIGLIIGVAVAFFAARAMSALLQGIEPQDPLTIATAALTCIVVVLAGCLRPALRASRVDPMSALRSS